MLNVLFILVVVGTVVWDLSQSSEFMLRAAKKTGLIMAGFALFSMFAADVPMSHMNWRWALGPWAVMMLVMAAGRARGAIGPDDRA